MAKLRWQDYFLNDILAQPGDLPVLNLALMPMEGFASVTQEVVRAVRHGLDFGSSKDRPTALPQR
jgi:hypothetical protein